MNHLCHGMKCYLYDYGPFFSTPTFPIRENHSLKFGGISRKVYIHTHTHTHTHPYITYSIVLCVFRPYINANSLYIYL